MCPVTSTPQSSRFAGVFFRAPGPFTIALAGYLSTPIISRSTDAPYARPRVQVDFETAYSRLLSVEFAQTSQTRTASLVATSGYTGGTRWDFVFPDLSGAAGWNSTWALRPAVPFTWTATGYRRGDCAVRCIHRRWCDVPDRVELVVAGGAVRGDRIKGTDVSIGSRRLSP